MTKPITTILALCFCVTLTAGAVAADKQHKEQIKLPAFHKQTVKIDGKDVAIQVRWFKKPFVVGSTDVSTLPKSAAKTGITAAQDMWNGKYKAYVNLFVDSKEAQQAIDVIKKLKNRHPKEYQTLTSRMTSRMEHAKLLGEVRVGAYNLIVGTSQGQKHREIDCLYLTRTADGFRILLPPYHGQPKDKMKQARAVGNLIKQGKLAPPKHSKNK